MTTKQPEQNPTERRRLARHLRAAAKRIEERKARTALRQKGLTQTKIAHAVSSEAKRTKVITYEDLDGDQLVAYRGIHEWWNVQVQIGGVSSPLTVGGYAGTGKSTLLAIALPVLLNADGSNVQIKYCAYTGKAANVLMQKGLDSQTVHSLIYHAKQGGGDVVFELKHRDEIEAQIIVVDEASMVPDDMRRDLESLGIPILYTGDHGQLPPVMGQGNVMKDPIFKLETPHRQALESGIIEIATMVRNRQRVKKGTYGKYGDAVVMGKSAIRDIHMLASADIVICYTNARRNDLNMKLREYKGFKGVFPKIGEKLICTKNNKQTRMFNGLIVYITSVELVEKYLVMDLIDEVGNKYLEIKSAIEYFQGEPHPKIFGQTFVNLFEFAYAITGHKSQGSQWDTVVVIEESMFNQNLDIKRRWVYTTLTRAAKSLIWITKNN